MMGCQQGFALHLSRRGIAGLLVLLLSACGGGGGGGDGGGPGNINAAKPGISAVLLSLPSDGSITKPLGVSTDSAASVQVVDVDTGASVTTATVTMNGTALAYDAAAERYRGDLTVNPGENVTVSVRWNGHTYSSTTKQVTTFPTVLAPTVGSTWNAQSANLVSWSAGSESATTQYLSAVFDTNGNIVWPDDGAVHQLPASEHSYTIQEDTLSPGERAVMLAIVDIHTFAEAAPGSQFSVGGFDVVPIVIEGFSGTPYALSVTPASASVVPGGTLQLAAIAQFSDGNSHDVTVPCTWTSSDPAVISVDDKGLVTAHGAGSVTIGVQYEGLAVTATVTVFQPNPSAAPPLGQSVTWQIDYAHSGRATVGPGGPVFPPTGSWSVTLDGLVSFPVIAEGKVFVTTNVNAISPADRGASLYALDVASGSIAWGPVALPVNNSPFTGHAYDHGHIYVVTDEGQLRSFNAATGAQDWLIQLTGYSYDAVPTAVNGVVYVGGFGGVTAVDERNGTVLWRAPAGGNSSSPAVDASGVYVSYSCDTFRFDLYASRQIWHYGGQCTGGTGYTPVLANGRLYIRGSYPDPPNKIFDTATGAVVGSYKSWLAPAISDHTGFFLEPNPDVGGALVARDLSSGAALWSFSDDNLYSSPIVIDNAVVIATAFGKIHAIDATNGNPLWNGQAGAQFDGLSGGPVTGLGAGEGWLVMPAHGTVSAWRIVH